MIFKLAETDNSIIKICLLKRYADVITDEDLDDLNSSNPSDGAFDLIFKGLCNKAVVLKMEKHSITLYHIIPC